MRARTRLVAGVILLLVAAPAHAAPKKFDSLDVFNLEWADDPQVSPDGSSIVYVRRGYDIMSDRARGNLWQVNTRTGAHEPLLSGTASYSQPRWSPDGTRLAYVTASDGGAQIYVRWVASGHTARITNMQEGPQNIRWSPDGKQIAFLADVPRESKPLASLPKPPEGAKWAPPLKVIDQTVFRADGGGYLEPTTTQLFVVPADGGTPRQVTTADYDHEGAPNWSPDGKAIILAANPEARTKEIPGNSDIFAVDVASGTETRLTSRFGPDQQPALSPDGKLIAYVGYDDKYQGYQNAVLSIMNADGSNPRAMTASLDRTVSDPVWAANGRGVYFLYDDQGVTKLGFVELTGKVRTIASDLGGTSTGRPYGGAAYSVGGGVVAYNKASPARPADLALFGSSGERILTQLNDDLLGDRTLGKVEKITVPSTKGAQIDAWVMTPPDYQPGKRYPTILEIHGGPFANYGPRFAAEMQLMAAHGYVVVYANPRGSDSYGEAFGNHIHHAYPGDDYDDLMAVTDAVIARGVADPDRLFVTGGSGGGVLTAWIIGKTDRFKAAVVAKPVINWTSFVLTADFTPFFFRYWFAQAPWEDGAQADYWRRSPLSLVGNVKTPTMMITGEADYRTPISETEQYYTALRLRGVPAVMVRVPEAPHNTDGRPSNLVGKVAHILAWFDKYGGKPTVN